MNHIVHVTGHKVCPQQRHTTQRAQEAARMLCFRKGGRGGLLKADPGKTCLLGEGSA